MSGLRPTVAGYLTAPLGAKRVQELERLAGEFATVPLTDTVAGLRDALDGGVGMEDFRRLHILISHLYHSCGADIPLITDLRAEVGKALTHRRARLDREGGDDRVLLEP